MVKDEIMATKKICKLILNNQDKMRSELLEALDESVNKLELNVDSLAKEMKIGFTRLNRTLDFWIDKIENSPKFRKRLASI